MSTSGGWRVTTAHGDLIGTRDGGVRSVHGVPFAAPPVGSLRWRAPRPPRSWARARSATVPGPAPVQPSVPYLPYLRTGEDCLHLSVWTPDEEGRWPVLVWLYGGGFESGAALTPVSDPRHLVGDQRVVVVAPHYRVGALGFAELSHHGGPFAEATNLGLRDVVAALSWVAANIGAFGGDPARVTVMGQSAGAFLAAALPATPAADGLYHRLAMFSGGASRLVPYARARTIGDAFLARLDELAGPAGQASTRLAGAAAEAVLAAQDGVRATDIGERNGPSPRAFGVVLDGTVVTTHPMEAATAATQVPMLLATTTEEVATLHGPEPFAPAGLAGIAGEVRSWGVAADRADAIVRHYAADRTADATREAVLTDYIYRLPALRLATTRAAAGGATWFCAFDRVPGLGPVAGHGCETPLLFGTTEDPWVMDLFGYRGERGGSRTALSMGFRAHLGAFVHGGEAGWPPVTVPDRIPGLVVGGEAVRPTADLCAGTRHLWEGIDRP